VAVDSPDTKCPPLLATHRNEAFDVEDEPLNAMDSVVQVSILSMPALTSGTALSRVTSAASVAQHPFPDQ
jgi:hypothetical protein